MDGMRSYIDRWQLYMVLLGVEPLKVLNVPRVGDLLTIRVLQAILSWSCNLKYEEWSFPPWVDLVQPRLILNATRDLIADVKWPFMNIVVMVPPNTLQIAQCCTWPLRLTIAPTSGFVVFALLVHFDSWGLPHYNCWENGLWSVYKEKKGDCPMALQRWVWSPQMTCGNSKIHLPPFFAHCIIKSLL